MSNLMDGLHVDHPRYERARQDALAYLDVCSDGGGIIPILGPTRCGKTDLLHVLHEQVNLTARLAGELPLDEFDNFLYGVVPPRPSDAGIYRTILRSIGALVSQSEKTDALRDRTIRLIRERDIRVIALDECSHCAEAGANFPKRAAADTFKFLRDQTGITFILSGLPKFQEIIQENEQLRERSMRTIELHPYQWSLEEDRTAFYGCVHAAVEHLKDNGVAVDLDLPDITKRLYGISGGRVGEMFELFKKTAVRLRTGDSLNAQSLERTAKMLFQQPAGLPDMFEFDRVPDFELSKAYARVMSDAGLSVPVRSALDIAAE